MQVGFSARLAWSTGHRRNLFTDRGLLAVEQRNSTADGACTLQCDADVSVAVTLPGVYGALLPRGILGACCCYINYMYEVSTLILGSYSHSLLFYLFQNLYNKSAQSCAEAFTRGMPCTTRS
jgi:hypothetical protein